MPMRDPSWCKTGDKYIPLCIPPPRPVILFNREAPPALILASRRSFLKRACSAARAAAASSVLAGSVSARSVYAVCVGFSGEGKSYLG